MSDYIIKYPSYSEGAILKSAVEDVTIDSKGNTMVTSIDGRVFNCHPLTKACGLPDRVERTIFDFIKLGIDPDQLDGCVVYHKPLYPIRWELSQSDISALRGE